MSKAAKTTILIMIVTLLSQISGFFRELVLSYNYGAHSISDAYIIALNVPTVIFAAIGIALGTTFIPMYFESESELGQQGSLKFTNNVFNIVLIIGTLLAIVGFIFVRPLVRLFAMNFEPKTFELAVSFTRVMIFGLAFIGLSNIMTAFLQIKNKFVVASAIGVPYNMIIITSIILSKKVDISILSIGTLFGLMCQFLMQYPFAKKFGYKYQPYINTKDKHLKKMLWLTGPVFIGVAVNQVNAMVDRTLASGLAPGSIAALNYANRLNFFVTAMFISSISTVIYPMLSKISAKDKDTKKFNEIVVTSVNSIVLIVMPISVGAMVLATPIVKLLFQRGAFDARATSMTAIALLFYSIGMVAFGLRDVLGKIFYSLQDTKTPMINGALAMILNIVINLITVQFMGHAGLALGTSIAAIICIFLLFGSLKKKVGYFGQDKIIKTMTKSLLSAVVMGACAFFSYGLLSSIFGSKSIGLIISLGGSVVIGAAVYAVLVIVLKVEETSIIIDALKKKLKRS